jgi:hypothetical protein
VVQDWRTGAIRRTVDLRNPIDWIALRADGRVAVVTYEHELYDIRPGAAPRRLRPIADRVEFAGDRLVFNRLNRLRVVEPDGRHRAFGVTTITFGGFDVEGERVLWVANGCLLVASVTQRRARSIGRGPCPRSELSVVDRANPNLARTIPVTLRCVAAPRRCRGTIRLRMPIGGRTISIPQRFSIPTGRVVRFDLRLHERGYRALRRVVARDEDGSVAVDARDAEGNLLTRGEGILVLPRGAR